MEKFQKTTFVGIMIEAVSFMTAEVVRTSCASPTLAGVCKTLHQVSWVGTPFVIGFAVMVAGLIGMMGVQMYRM